MTEETLHASPEAPLKRRIEEPINPHDLKKPRDADARDASAAENHGTNFSGSAVAETELEHGSEKIDLFQASGEAPVAEIGNLKPGKGEVEEAEKGEFEEASASADEELKNPSENDEDVEASVEGEDEGSEDEEEEEEEEAGDEDEASSEVDSDDGDSESDEDSDASSDEEAAAAATSQNPEDALEPPQGRNSKGKEKDDIKGKAILTDKGKGKAEVEEVVSDEDDAGYLSEDPLEEVDLNNILPTRTRRRSGQSFHFDPSEFDEGDEDDDDSDT